MERSRIRQQISYLLAVVLLMMGMQADIKPVNPSYLRADNTVSSSALQTVIYSASYLDEPDVVCTYDMVRRIASVYQNNMKALVSTRILRIAFILLAAELFLLYKCYCRDVIDEIAKRLVDCHMAVVLYIHQKDGEK